MQNIPNGGRPIRFIRLVRPPPQVVVIKQSSESYQEVTIPEIPTDNK